MYVRIIDLRHGHSVLHECKQITFNKLLKSDDSYIISIDIQGSETCKTIEIYKRYNEIYIMNNDGKTIESHRWPDWNEDEDNKIKIVTKIPPKPKPAEVVRRKK